MISDFKQRVLKYKQNGDRLVIDEILYGVTFDFMNDPTRKHTPLSPSKLLVTIDLPRHEYYISYRIRVLRDFALSMYRGERKDIQSNEFNRILSVIRIDLGIDFNGEIIGEDEWCYRFRITADLISNLRELQMQIKQDLDYGEYYKLCYYLDKYGKETSSVEKEYAVAETKVDENILVALERALSYVDTSKSEKEIVKYVNKAFSTRFGELELARKGMQRIMRVNRHGDKVTLHITKKFPQDNYTAIIPKLDVDKVAQLHPKQRDVMERLYKIVELDRCRGDLSGYSCQNNGTALIKRNYAAEKLGESPINFRKMLSRVSKKVTK